MKGIKKIVLSLLAMFALVLVIQVPTQAAEKVYLVSQNDNSVTVAWDVPQLSSIYAIIGYQITDYNTGETLWSTNVGSTNSATISGLPVGYSSQLKISYTEQNINTSSSYYGQTYTFSLGYVYVNTKVASVAKNTFGISQLYSSLGKLNIGVVRPQYAYENTSAQFVIYKVNKKGKWEKSKTSTVSSAIGGLYEISGLKPTKNTSYKFKVRYVVNNPSNGKTYYGAWSSYCYYNNTTVQYIKNSTPKKGITFKLKKGYGIKKYKIYLSTNNKSFKLVKTVNVTSKSKSTINVVVNKYNKASLKKNKKYYFKIVSVLLGGKTNSIVNQSSNEYDYIKFY